MSKKYIVINGKKHYIKDEDAEAVENTAEETEEAAEETEETPEETPEETEETPEPEDATEEKRIKAEAKKVADNILKTISAEIGQSDEVKKLNKRIDDIMQNVMPMDDRLKQILNGKSLDSDQLTKDEKILAFYHACMTQNEPAVKALSEGTNADGGFLVPAEFRAEVVRQLGEMSLVRQIARVVPMKRLTLNAVSVVSGPEVYWTNEGATKSTTTVHFGQPTLTAYKLAAILYTSDELVEDSDQIDVVQLVITLFAERIAQAENRAFGQGTGTGQPTGLDTAVTATTITGVASAGPMNFDEIIDLEYALAPQYRANAVYLAHSEVVRNMRKIKDGNNRYLWDDRTTVDGEPPRFNGKKVYEFDHISTANLYFGDFKRGYWWGDRKQMSVLLSQHTTTAFTQDKTAIRVVERVAGNVVWGNAIKVLSGLT